MRRLSGLIATLLLAAGVGPALAAGEGSGTNNPDLLDATPGPASATLPREGMGGYFDIDWGVGLRGAYSVDSGGPERAVQVTPEFTLTHQGVRLNSTVTGSGELVVDDAGEARVTALRLGADAVFAIDEFTAATGSGELSMTQADANDPSLPPNTAIAPVVLTGEGAASVARKFGRVEATLRGSLGRSLHSETVLDDSSTIDNTALNDTRVGVGGRLGVALTPLLTPYVDAGVEWQRFDAPDPMLLVSLDAVTYSASAGIAYLRNDTLSADASIGLAWRDYVDASLTDAGSVTATASVNVKPDETLSVTASLETGLAPSTSVPGDTTASHDASASVAYVVNPSLTLRGRAGYGVDRILGTGDISQNASLGAGLDYKLTPHTALTADYEFTRTLAPPAPVADTHSVALGMKFSR